MLNRLTIFTMAELARRRRARGRKLNVPEATAIVCDEIMEWAWDGMPLAEVIDRASSLLSRGDLMDGVPEIVGSIEVDALFPSGTALVVVSEPFGPLDGGIDGAPGEVISAAGPVAIGSNAGDPVSITVRNPTDVPIEVTSHFHFSEANRHLEFDRRRAYGMRLDLPAGESVRWRAGATREVDLIPIGGAREVWGFAGIVDGPLDQIDATAALDESIRRGYTHTEDPDAG